MASRFGVHPNQIYQWKALLVDDTASVFEAGRGGRNKADVALVSELYGKIGEHSAGTISRLARCAATRRGLNGNAETIRTDV